MNSGILILNKPEGISSTFAGNICKKILKTKKLGHLGTLDPFATGVLPIAVNDGTKAIPYIKIDKKTYEFEIKFGEKTNTGDKTGEIVETSNLIPNIEQIQNTIRTFIGEIFQTPHAFSAIKIDGKRAYDIARSGQIPNIKARKTTIFGLKLLEQTAENIYKFSATVSPGTYIRTLSEDIAKSLETLGHTISLKRTMDGKFSIEQAISLDNLREKCENLECVLIPPEDVLDDIPVIFISDLDAENLMKGRTISVSDRFSDGTTCSAISPGGFLGIVQYDNECINPKRIIKIFERS